MKTVKHVSKAFNAQLLGLYDEREINSLYMLVLSEVASISSAKIKAFPELEITDEQADTIEKVLLRLQTGEPLQYILGHTEFYGLMFKVNPSVLIPRPETEELVDWVLLSAPKKPLRILDIGTGSGCIAISLKKKIPDAQVYAIDISTDALQTAKQNAALNQVDIHFVQADILNIEVDLPPFDIIISNPPYVTLDDKKQMHQNVIDFEPHTALFVPENEPLLFYKAIADFALKQLEENGLLFFEINENYGKQTVELLSDNGLKDIELRNDMSNRARMTKAQFRG